jgi:hypothetical protein
VREAFTWLLVWSLSPLGTLLNAAMLAVVLVAAGADWSQPMLWVIVAIFVAAAGYLDVRAYVARKRHGLTAYQAGEAVMDRIWGPRTEESVAEEERPVEEER